MTKTLHVIDPFFIAEIGDIFELDETGNTYSLVKSEEFYKIAGDETSEIQSSCTSTFNISIDYAKKLVKDGYLEEEVEHKNTTFRNVFDEINDLIDKYTNELNDMCNQKDMPKCVQVEKETVLNNLITMLNYLKDLKK